MEHERTGPRRAAAWIAASLLLALSLACGGDRGTGPDDVLPAALLGQWVANEACLAQGCGFTLRDVATGDSLNIISGSASMSMLVQSTGRIILTIPPFPSAEGTARVNGNRIYIASGQTQKTDTVDFAIAGGALHLDFLSHFDNFDVDGDGQADLARARAVLVRP